MFQIKEAMKLYKKVKESIENNEKLDWFQKYGIVFPITEGSTIDEVLTLDAKNQYEDHFVIKGNPKITLLSEKVKNNKKEIYYSYEFKKGDVLLVYKQNQSFVYICK